MINTGLVSVTFRKLSPREVIDLVQKSGLQGIEWGGDIHVPHGDIKKAREVYRMTTDAGISIASYGSYYKAGCERDGATTFEQVLETALTLHAPGIRVWAGDRPSAEADWRWFEKVGSDSKRIADMAQRERVRISFEYHRDTLTDTLGSTITLLESTSHENAYIYWQPPEILDSEQNIADLTRLRDRVTNVHVFHWNGHERLPLDQGFESWRKYLHVIKGAKTERYCLLEFVKDDSSRMFLKDAETLKRLIE